MRTSRDVGLTGWGLKAVAVATLSMGCAEVPAPELADSFASVRQEREAQMRERWAGRLYADLVAEMGRTGESMTVPSKRGETRSAVVFGINDPLSGCVDSFVVINGDEPIIGDYYCR